MRFCAGQPDPEEVVIRDNCYSTHTTALAIPIAEKLSAGMIVVLIVWEKGMQHNADGTTVHLFADSTLKNGWTDTESQAFHLCAAT